MRKQMKVMGLVAMLMVSCLVVAGVSMNDAASADSVDSAPVYRGYDAKVETLDALFVKLHEQNPDIPLLNSEAIELLLKNQAEERGIEADKVSLDIDFKAGTCMVAEKIHKHLFEIQRASKMLITMDLEIPMGLVHSLIDSQFGTGDYDPSTNNNLLILHDFTIELDTVVHSNIALNEKSELTLYDAYSERTIHIAGNTNLDVVAGEFHFDPNASNAIDWIAVSTLYNKVEFGEQGFKFKPDNDSDLAWDVNAFAHATKLGTIHNVTNGGIPELIDKMYEHLEEKIEYPLILNPENHSGVVIHNNHVKNFDFKCEVEFDEGGNRHVSYINNSEPASSHISPFYDPFSLLGYGGFFSDISEVSDADFSLTPEKALDIEKKIERVGDAIDAHTEGLKVNVIYLTEDAKEVISKDVIDYGTTHYKEIQQPEKEGMLSVGWRIAGTGGVPWVSSCPVTCDLILVPQYAVILDTAPTQKDFNDNPDQPLAWIYDVSKSDGIFDASILKDNPGRLLYVIAMNGDEVVYKWQMISNGLESELGEVDTTISITQPPTHVASKLAGQDIIYLDLGGYNVLPVDTSFSICLGDLAKSERYLVFHDDGDDIYVSQTRHVHDGNIVLKMVSKANGFALIPDNPSSVTGYWGVMTEYGNIEDLLTALNERYPELGVSSVADLEKMLKEYAEEKGCDSSVIKLDLDVLAGIVILGEKLKDSNTASLSTAAWTDVSLHIEIPLDLIAPMFNKDYVPTSNVLIMDLFIEVDKVKDTDFTMNEDGPLATFFSFAERTIHVTGNTNVSITDDGKFVFSDNVDVPIDHLMVSTMTHMATFGADGFKFLPDNENDTSWNNDLDAMVVSSGTIHNEAGTEFTAKLLDLIAAQRESDPNDPHTINPYTHSGFIRYFSGEMNYNYTCEVKYDEHGNRYVDFTDNNATDDDRPHLPFFQPLSFIFMDKEVSMTAFSKFFSKENAILNVKAEEYAFYIEDSKKNYVDRHTEGIEVEVFYFNPGEFPDGTPVRIDKVAYGTVPELDYVPQLAEGEVFLGWAQASSMEPWHHHSILFCDIALVPVIGHEIDHSPVEEDFQQYPNDILIWKYMAGSADGKLDWELLKSYPGHGVIVVVEDMNGVLYRMALSADGTESATGMLDTRVLWSEAPDNVKSMFSGKEYVYLDFLNESMFPAEAFFSTSLIGTPLEREKSIQLFHVEGDEISYVSTIPVLHGYVNFHPEVCSGYVLVGSSVVSDVWGGEHDYESIVEILEVLKKRNPEFQFSSVEEIEQALKDLVDDYGCDPDKVILGLDMQQGTFTLGERVDVNTVFNTTAGYVKIYLDLQLPKDFLAKLFYDGYNLKTDELVILKDVEIEIDKTRTIVTHFSKDGKIVNMHSIAERTIHIVGYTNAWIDDNGKFEFKATPDVETELLMVSTMDNAILFGDGGLKFLPNVNNDDGWDVKIPIDFFRVGTIHNVAGTEYSEKFLDILATLVRNDPYFDMIINPDTHSGFVLNDVGDGLLDLTCEVKYDENGNRYVVFNNNSETDDGPHFPFYQPFAFIMGNDSIPLSALSHMLGSHEPITPGQAADIREKIDICQKEHIDVLTKDLVLNVKYVSPGSQIGDEPITIESVKYGDSVSMDVHPELAEGEVFMGWINAINGERWHHDTPVYCDMILEAVIGRVIDHAPTQQDFSAYPNNVLVWRYEKGTADGKLDWSLLKANAGHGVSVEVTKDGKTIYRMTFAAVGNETASGVIDTTVNLGEAPAFVKDLFKGREYVYLDMPGDCVLPKNTVFSPLLSSDICDFKEGDTVDVFLVKGDEVVYYASLPMFHEHLILHIDEAVGIVIVGGDVPEPVPVTGVTLDKTAATVYVGGELQLNALVAPENATNKNIIWLTSDNTIATVDFNGIIKALKVGTVEITALTEDGRFTATCTVTVKLEPVPVKGVELNINTLDIEVGNDFTLIETITPDNAGNKAVTWSSSDSSVVTVDYKGKISALKIGTATITVTTVDGGFTATCTVTVSSSESDVPVTGVTLDKTSATLVEGDTVKLMPFVAPEDASSKAVTWSSSDSSIATVDPNGIVTAVKSGTATITVTTVDGGFTATCEITVNAQSSGSDNTLILAGVAAVVIVLCAGLAFVMLRRKGI